MTFEPLASSWKRQCSKGDGNDYPYHREDVRGMVPCLARIAGHFMGRD